MVIPSLYLYNKSLTSHFPPRRSWESARVEAGPLHVGAADADTNTIDAGAGGGSGTGEWFPFSLAWLVGLLGA